MAVLYDILVKFIVSFFIFYFFLFQFLLSLFFFYYSQEYQDQVDI